MKRVGVHITALSPLCFSERRAGAQFRPSVGYIPGAALRGAVAGALLRAAGADAPIFRRIFGISEPPAALFRNAYPALRVLPQTALSCKDQPGFGRTPAHHGVFDSLIDLLCCEQLRPPGLLYLPRCQHAEGESACNSRVEAFGGFYDSKDTRHESRVVPQRLLTRVAINRRRMVAEDELLYSPMVLTEAWWTDARTSACAQFRSSVWVENDIAEEVTRLLADVQHVGSGSARGLGQVKVRVDQADADADTMTSHEALDSRVNRFNRALAERWELMRKLLDGEAPVCPQLFTVNLRADAVLKEHGWLPTTTLSSALLREATGVHDSSLALVRSFASPTPRGGWNSGQGLPKPTELATRMGSVFVFRTQHIARWADALVDLEARGVGERTAEGLGEVTICDDFHVEGRAPQ